jgi:thiol-disulfide isomerase/thioredoxin
VSATREPSTSGETPARVHGRVLDHAGRPWPHALVTASLTSAQGTIAFGQDPVRADRRGRFAIDVPRDEWVKITALGAGHLGSTVATVVSGRKLGVDLQLSTHPEYALRHAKVHWLDVERHVRGTTKLESRSDGTYAATIDAQPGVLRFWIKDMLSGLDYVGPGCEARGEVAATHIEPARRTWLLETELERGRATIVCDPAAMPPPRRDQRVEFADPDQPAARIALLAARRDRLWQGEPDRRSYACARGRDELGATINEEDDRLVRTAGAILAFSLPATSPEDCPPMPELAHELLSSASPDSKLWRGNGGALRAALLDARGDDRADWTEAIAAWPPAVRAQALTSEHRWARMLGDDARADAIAERLEAPDYAELFVVQIWKRELEAPDFEGRSIPEFSYPSLDGEGSLGSEQFAGSVTVMHFWATWCAGCIMEMSQVHDLHDKWSDRGLQMFSINVGDDPERVANFRRERFPLPWSNVKASTTRVKKQFGVSTFPTLLLIDRSGTIVAGPVEPEELDARLAELLK